MSFLCFNFHKKKYSKLFYIRKYHLYGDIINLSVMGHFMLRGCELCRGWRLPPWEVGGAAVIVLIWAWLISRWWGLVLRFALLLRTQRVYVGGGSWFAGWAPMSQLCPGYSDLAPGFWRPGLVAHMHCWFCHGDHQFGVAQAFYSVGRHLGLGVKSCNKADGKCSQMQELH